MESLSSLLASLLIIWCVDSGVASASPGCVPNNNSDSVVAIRILEFPSGPVDGSNRVFSLSRIPFGTSVQVFEDGNELESDSVFTVNSSNKLTLGQAPRPGEILQVGYCTQEMSPSVGKIISPDDARALIRTAFIESVQRDQPIAAGSYSLQQHRAATSSGASSKDIEPRSAFLSLLSRRMHEADDSADLRAQDTLNGFDGTGDVSLGAPFAELIEENSPNPDSYVRGLGVSGVPRSLRLLRQRLASATNDHRNVRTEGTP